MRTLGRRYLALAVVLVMVSVIPSPSVAEGLMNPDKPVGGTVIIEQPYGPTQFAQSVASGGAYWLSWNLYDRIVDFDSHGDPVPGLAQTWEVSSDAKTFTFHLNPNAKWHNGQPVTATDVKWFIDTVISEQHPGIAMFANVASTTALDAHTLIITLSQPDGSFLAQLGHGYGYTNVVYRGCLEGKVWETADCILTNPIGSGPFKFSRYVTGDFVELVANPDYHLGRPNVDKLVLKVVPNIASALQMLETGEIDALSSFVPYAEVPRLRANPEITVTTTPSMWALTFEMNTHSVPLNNTLVRRALAMAIDRNDINQKVFNGLSTSTNGTYTSYVPWAFNPNAKLPAFNPTMAEQLLDQAGYPRGTNGVRFTVDIVSGDWAGFIAETAANVVKEHLRAIGVEANYQMLEWGTMIQRVFIDHQFQIHIYPGEWQGPDPAMVSRLYSTGADRNTMQYSNAEVDQLFQQGIQTFDRNVRKQAYYRIQEILADEVPLIFLNDVVLVFANRKAFHAFPYEGAATFMGATPRYSGVWWEGGAVAPSGIDPVILGLGIGVAAVAAVAVGYLVIMRRRRRKKEE